MTKRLPTPRESPLRKYTKIAALVRTNGKTTITRMAATVGYSPIYFKYNILPTLMDFFDEVQTDGQSVWSAPVEVAPGGVKDVLKKHQEAVPT